MLFSSNTLFIGGVKFGVIENSLMSLWGQKENVSIEENSPLIRDFMDERSLKLTKIFSLNLECQNLPFRGSLASSKLNLFLFPEI